MNSGLHPIQIVLIIKVNPKNIITLQLDQYKTNQQLKSKQSISSINKITINQSIN